MFGGRANQGAQQYWSKTSYSYKFCCLTSTIIFLISLLIPAIAIFLIDIPQLTIWSFQIWRLFFAFYAQMPQMTSLLGILFTFMWVHNILKDEEVSTVYRLVQIFIINLQVQIALNVICFLFTIIFQTENVMLFFGYGWFPIIIIYEFRNSVIDPQAQRRFCCLPFLIKSKYFPWVIIFFSVIFTFSIFQIVACALVGYYQQVIRKQMIIKLPLGFYKKLESCLPNQITNRLDFVKIQQVENYLKTKCWNSSSPSQSRNNNRNNPFQQQNYNQNNAGSFYPQTQQSNTVQASKGVSIGGQQAANFKNVWADKNQNDFNYQNQNNGQFEIQPKQPYNNKHKFPQISQETHAELNDNNSGDQVLLQQHKQQNKKNKNKSNDNDLI